MASKKHDRILTFVAGKMQRLGFVVRYMEGRHHDVTSVKPALPLTIINHRPDVLGFRATGAFCIGEAKTLNDFKSARTKRQLLDFRNIVRLHSDNLLIIGVPVGTKSELITVLRTLGIVLDSQIDIIEVPEQFISQS